jgi:hypothetical protein
MCRLSVYLVALVALAACGAGEAARTLPGGRASPDGAGPAADGGPPASTAAAESAARSSADSAIVRGLYVNRWAVQSPSRMRALIAVADSTEINALVLDMKDEFGLNYQTKDPVAAPNAGNAGRVANLKALLDTLKAHGILPIARIVVFKDSVAARVNPGHTIRKADGSAWRDKEGLTWVSPYDETIWEYNIRVAEELVRLGFGEVQFDYIRFPEPYPSLPRQIFPNANGRSKQQALAGFLARARERLTRLGVRTTADIFGLVTTVPGSLEIGQQWELLAPVTDVLLPMVYPSHYPRGAFGIARPNTEPYRVVYAAIARAHERDLKLGIQSDGHVRPWLQAFSLPRMLPKYGAHEVREQKRAVYDAGYDGWILWHPGSRYEAVMAALDSALVSRKRPFTPGQRTPVVSAARAETIAGARGDSATRSDSARRAVP